jgi:predicted nucleic acid-binding protein
MTYLLDVNALVALGFANHEFHDRVGTWVRALPAARLATCSITELGFVRVLAHAPAYGLTVAQARTLLLRMKQADLFCFDFLADDHDLSHLPTWVKTPKQITDGHLAELARAHGGALATLDARIPGAYLIPET